MKGAPSHQHCIYTGHLCVICCVIVLKSLQSILQIYCLCQRLDEGLHYINAMFIN